MSLILKKMIENSYCALINEVRLVILHVYTNLA